MTDVDDEGDDVLAAFRLRDGPGGSCERQRAGAVPLPRQKFTEWRQLARGRGSPGGAL